MSKVEEPLEDEVKSSKKRAVDEDKIRHPLLQVDHSPEPAPRPSLGEASPVEHKDQQLQEVSTIEEEQDTERADDEVDPFESSYYMIDELLTKLINIGIERNDCQLRRVEVLKELEKSKKLHDYLSSLHGTSVPNGAAIERQGGAYILYFQQTFFYVRIKCTCKVEQDFFSPWQWRIFSKLKIIYLVTLLCVKYTPLSGSPDRSCRV